MDLFVKNLSIKVVNWAATWHVREVDTAPSVMRNVVIPFLSAHGCSAVHKNEADHSRFFVRNNKYSRGGFHKELRLVLS